MVHHSAPRNGGNDFSNDGTFHRENEYVIYLDSFILDSFAPSKNQNEPIFSMVISYCSAYIATC